MRRSRIAIGVVATACLVLFLKYESIISRLTDLRIQSGIGIKRLAPAPSTETVPTGPFSMSDVYQWNKNVTVPPPYQDPAFLKSCSMDMKMRRDLFHLLKYWMELAAKHNITWFLSCGTNVGSLRHRDIIPWDHDMDFSVMEADEEIIRRIAVKKHRTMNRNHPNLVVRYSDFCPVNAKRRNCQDKIVNSQVDHCAFCGPLARVIGRGLFMDLFRVSLRNTSDGVRLRDEMFAYQKEKEMFRFADYFPLKPCNFMGLKLLCLRRDKAVTLQLYKTLRPPNICDNGRWVKAKFKETL